MFKNYRLKDGSIYWHKLYYDIMPRFMTKYAPPFGDMNYAGYLCKPYQYGIDLYYKSKWFIQRGSRGYSDYDVCGLDSYLVGWMPKALRQLRDNKLGHPIGMTVKGWRTRLEAMAGGFDAAYDIMDLKYEHKSAEERAAWQRFNRGMKLFHRHFFSLWD